MTYDLFNRIICANLHFWVQTHIDKDFGVVPDILLRVKTQCYNHIAINGFSDEEREFLKELEKSPDFIGESEKPISYLMHALLVLKFWVEDIPKSRRPLLNISDKKMVHGKALYMKHMLLAKEYDPELYASEKDIIADTESAAIRWFEYFKNQLLKED